MTRSERRHIQKYIKINESQYIALFVVGRSIKKLVLTDLPRFIFS